jgi:23S rRNA (pseudouridine1915-N3)-methyltransferase
MTILLATVSRKRTSSAGPYSELVRDYVERCARYIGCTHRVFSSEEGLLNYADVSTTRTRPALLLTDSQGQQLSSREIAGVIGSLQDHGMQQVILGVGPADGWTSAALQRADKTIAFGRITLPHELAAVIAAEQLYRALTIRAGHPYHSGH